MKGKPRYTNDIHAGKQHLLLMNNFSCETNGTEHPSCPSDGDQAFVRNRARARQACKSAKEERTDQRQHFELQGLSEGQLKVLEELAGLVSCNLPGLVGVNLRLRSALLMHTFGGAR